MNLISWVSSLCRIGAPTYNMQYLFQILLEKSYLNSDSLHGLECSLILLPSGQVRNSRTVIRT